MADLSTLKSKLQEAADKMNSAEPFSREWFVAKAEVETLSQEINEIKFVNRQKQNRCPADFIFEDQGWDD